MGCLYMSSMTLPGDANVFVLRRSAKLLRESEQYVTDVMRVLEVSCCCYCCCSCNKLLEGALRISSWSWLGGEMLVLSHQWRIRKQNSQLANTRPVLSAFIHIVPGYVFALLFSFFICCYAVHPVRTGRKLLHHIPPNKPA